VRGEVLATPLLNFQSILSPQQQVNIVMRSGTVISGTIRSIKQSGRSVAIAFCGIDNPEDAAVLRGAMIKVDSSALPVLDEGEYYYHEIIGLDVITTSGEHLGRIADIIETGSNDVYCIKGNGKEYLVPAIRDVIESIDIPGKCMKIRPIEGLID